MGGWWCGMFWGPSENLWEPWVLEDPWAQWGIRFKLPPLKAFKGETTPDRGGM